MNFLAYPYTDTDDLIKKVDKISPDPGTILICPVSDSSSYVDIDRMKKLMSSYLCRIIIGPFQGKTYFINETGEILKTIDQCHFLDGGENNDENVPAILTIEGVRFGVFTNEDLIFPELARTLCLAGAEIMVYLCNMPVHMLECITRTRSFENGTPLIAASGTGISFWIDYDGSVKSEIRSLKKPSPIKWRKQLFSHRQVQSYRILTLHIDS